MYRLIIVGLLVTMLSCENKKSADTNIPAKNVSTDSGYTVKGKITGLDSGLIFLKTDKKIDTAKIEKGNFEFSGSVTEPEYVMLGIVSSADTFKEPLQFFIEPGIITVQTAADSLPNAKVTGSANQSDLEKFFITLKPWEEKNKILVTQYEQANVDRNKIKINEILKDAEKLDIERKELMITYAKENPGSYAAAWQLAVAFDADADPILLASAYNSLSEKIKSSKYGNQLKESFVLSKKAPVGAMAPEFALNDVNGKPIALSSYKGKYTLVEFWSSNCARCRLESPNIIKAYNTYKAKGFDVLGVSLDNKKENWEKAIKEDKLPWTQVSDLEGWESKPAALYGIKFIPMNFLLDKDGKIMAKKLWGNSLLRKLEELLN